MGTCGPTVLLAAALVSAQVSFLLLIGRLVSIRSRRRKSMHAASDACSQYSAFEFQGE